MPDREDFVAWVQTTLYDAELALHNGDAASRNAFGQREVDELFAFLAKSFSHCPSFEIEFRAYDVVRDVA